MNLTNSTPSKEWAGSMICMTKCTTIKQRWCTHNSNSSKCNKNTTVKKKMKTECKVSMWKD